MSTTIKLAIGSLILGFVVLALKGLAYWITGSVALLSDALESTVNVATALAALIAVRVAAKPADTNHPYGHHKAEFFSAVLEGVMIIIAALLILREAYSAERMFREMTLLSLVSAATLWIGLGWAAFVIENTTAALWVIALHRLPEAAILLVLGYRQGRVSVFREPAFLAFFALGAGCGWLVVAISEVLGQ